MGLKRREIHQTMLRQGEQGMNKQVLVATGVLLLILSMAMFALRNRTVLYECRVEFQYEDGKPFEVNTPQEKFVCRADEHNRRVGYELLSAEFKREWHSFPLSERIRRCQRNPALQGESEDRIKDILSSLQLDVVGMPCTNFVYPCRLLLSDGSRRNLGEYARCCMDIVKEKVDEDNRIALYKCAFGEYQRMRKAERRITELEKSIAGGSADPITAKELQQARQTVTEMETKIDEIRRKMMARHPRQIVYESEPKVIWVIRRKARKGSRP